MIEADARCGACGHPIHWRACRAAGNGRLVDGCYCRRRGPHSDAPLTAEQQATRAGRAPYHEGRPILREISDHSTAILCPLGHVYHVVRSGEWGGSIWEAKAGDPAWTIRCEGAIR
jgi:hypothetical protein